MSREHENLTGFGMENVENGCMNHVPRMGCFVIRVERMRRENTTRKRDRSSEEACCVIPPTP
jgi:hypothetical protein